MTAFRLETFDPDGGRSSAAAAPPPLTERDVEAAREDGYRAGYVAAQDELTRAHLADASRLTSDFIEALNDSRLTNEAARRHVAASLAPLVLAICDAVAPALARAGLGAEILSRVERALAAAPAARPKLRCAPELVPTLERLFAGRGEPAAIEAAPGLLPREVELHWDEGHDRIDLDGCVAEIRACLARHLDLDAAPPTDGDALG